jgi:glutamate-1-semialdehyde 2,1-aminomutase
MAVEAAQTWASWEATTPRSKELFDRAQRVLPGGVNSPVRGTSSFRPYPIYLERGEGAHVIDVDGNRYIDVIMGLGPVVLGHNEPSVVAAVAEQVAQGSIFATCQRSTTSGLRTSHSRRRVVPITGQCLTVDAGWAV